MQGLRPLFLTASGVLRSELRHTGTRKKQPSFLRLASRQGKHSKQLTPRRLVRLYRIMFAAHANFGNGRAIMIPLQVYSLLLYPQVVDNGRA